MTNDLEQMSMELLAGRTGAPEPGQAHDDGHDTEHRAAAAIAGVSGRLRIAVLLALEVAGPDGMTDLEIEAALDLNRPSGGNRRGELVALGLVNPTGARRLSPSGRPCVVWVINDLGRRIAAEIRTNQTAPSGGDRHE